VISARRVRNWIGTVIFVASFIAATNRDLEADVAATAKRALASSFDDLGSATFRADLASLRHETQYTRLFRS